MEFAFPPSPPGYGFVLTARWLLAAWAVIGVGVLSVRIRHWKFIRPHEMTRWIVAAAVSGIIAGFGYCPFHIWDTNEWLIPALTAVLAVSAAGVAVGLAKRYTEGSVQEIKWALAIVLIAMFVNMSQLLLAPAVGSHRAAPKLACLNNLRNIGSATQGILNSSRSFPPTHSGAGPTSWRVHLLPQLDATSIFRQYDQQTPWDQPPNEQLAKVWLPVFTCPSNYTRKDAKGRWYTSFSMLTGPHTVGDNPDGTPVADITDGTSNTLLIVEASGSQIVWTEPRDVNVATQPAGINLKGTKPGNSAGWLSSYHAGGVNVMMADGSARFLSARTAPAVLKKLATIDGGETVRPNDF